MQIVYSIVPWISVLLQTVYSIVSLDQYTICRLYTLKFPLDKYTILDCIHYSPPWISILLQIVYSIVHSGLVNYMQIVYSIVPLDQYTIVDCILYSSAGLVYQCRLYTHISILFQIVYAIVTLDQYTILDCILLLVYYFRLYTLQSPMDQ